MRILVHDFVGHPFQVDLSRALAARGHEVTHAYCASLTATPQGDLTLRTGDSDGLSFRPLAVPGFDRTNLVRRFTGERTYGRLLARAIGAAAPDVVLSANTPLDAQAMALRATRALRPEAHFVFWLQDLIGEATRRLLGPRLPIAGALIGRHYQALEARLLRRSDAVVAITDDFRPVLERMKVARARVTVVENWSPIAEVPVRAQDNAWSRAHGLAGQTALVYTGTLGMKHDPMLLVALAEAFRDRPDVHVVVTSQGVGAEVVRAEAERRGLDRLRVAGFQPFEAMADVMGAATVLVALLEPDAGVFSVPSKVLSYLCAARPVLLAVPDDNLAARIVARGDGAHPAGLVVPPGHPDAFAAAARTLLADADLRSRMGAAGRAYAERSFDIDTIADRFEAIFDGLEARADAM